MALRSAAQIGRDAARDIHPPLYYWLLAGWVRLLGDSVFAMRVLSAGLGVLCVAGVMGLASVLLGRTAALAAGIAATTSPFLIWYSQEVRSYILVAALTPILVYLGAVSCDRRRGIGWWLLVAALSAAAIFSHYLCGGVAVVLANVVFALSAIRRHRERAGSLRSHVIGWSGAQGVALGAFAPWIVYALPALASWPATSDPLSLTDLVGESLVHLAMGNGPRAEGSVAVIAMWAVTGAVISLRSGRSGATPGVPVLMVAAAPTALAYLALTRPAWDPKFLAPSAPGFELLVGAGIVAPAIAARARWGRSAGVVAFVLACATVIAPRLDTVSAVSSDPAYHRDDYRGIARFVHETSTQQDAVLLNAPTQIEVFGYYHRRSAIPVYGLPESRPPDEAATIRRTEEIASAHHDLYGVLWATSESDPTGVMELWLNTHRPKAFDLWFGNVRLALWGRAASDPIETNRSAEFGGVLRLEKLTLGANPVRVTEVIELTATWLPVAPVGRDLIVFAQLLDGQGALVAGRDLAPVGGSAATSTWDVGAGAQVDRIGLAIPPNVSAGTYHLVLGVYDAATGQRLPVSGAPAEFATADTLIVGPLVVQGP